VTGYSTAIVHAMNTISRPLILQPTEAHLANRNTTVWTQRCVQLILMSSVVSCVLMSCSCLTSDYTCLQFAADAMSLHWPASNYLEGLAANFSGAERQQTLAFSATAQPSQASCGMECVLLAGISCVIFLLAIIVFVPVFRLRTWPNSYIVDEALLEGSCWTKAKVRVFAFCRVIQDTYFGPRFYDVIDDDFFSVIETNDLEDPGVAPRRTCGFGTIQNPPRGSRARNTVRQPAWHPGTGEGLEMRCGPDYKRQRRKQESNSHMYECISMDIIRADHKIERVLDSLLEVPPHCAVGNGHLSWTPDSVLPRVICVNVQLPYKGMNPLGAHDPGCSIVSIFHVTGETLQLVEDPNCPPSLTLFKNFCAGPDGRLNNRLQPSQKQTNTSGLFKAVAFCTNLENCTAGMHGADLASKFNGKPCLITKSGNMIKDSSGNREWIEISVDVRLFATAARIMLAQCRDRIAKAHIHVGFFIQGCDDRELPEGLIGDVFLDCVHLDQDAKDVSDRALPAIN